MSEDEQPESNEPEAKQATGFSAFWKELRRRHVVRVAITYAVVGWAIMQVAGLTFEGFDIPIWAFRFVMLMVILGFPLAIIVAWAFELTPEGIKTTKTAKVQHPDSHEDKSHVKKRHWFSLGMAAAVPTLIFGALAVYFYFQAGNSASEPNVTSAAPVFEVEENEKSIAVLPLENMSPDPDNAFFADGVQEDILTNLSKIKEMGVVISRSSTLKYRDPDRNLKQVGQELGVRYIVEGSVRRAANQVRVTVQLIDSQTDDHLWAENYDRSLDNIFAIQAEIAKQIADQLQAVISPQEIAQIEIRPTENQEAYDAYLLANNGEITSRSEMGPLLEKAVALDPQYYQAWAELARYRIEEWNGSASNRQDAELYSKAHRALEEAKRLGPDSPELLVAQAAFSYSEDDDLGQSIDYSVKGRLKGLASNNIGYRYLQLGQLDESQLYLEETVRMDPFPRTNQVRLFHTYILKGMWDEAEAFAERNVELLAGSEMLRLMFWQERSSFLEFIRTADLGAYKNQIKNRLNHTNYRGPIAYSILSRNLNDGIGHIEERIDGTVNLMNIGGNIGPNIIGFSIHPANLVAALIHFELDEKDASLERAKEVASYLEKLVSGPHKIKPQHLATLSICYALENDRHKVESTIPKIRALTDDFNWKYRAQVECEMHIAIAHLILGDHDKAIETLEAASEMDGPIFLIRELDLWFIFDRLRGDPRFDALLEG